MNRSLRILSLLILIFALSLGGCGLRDTAVSAPEPTAVPPAEAPADAAEPTEVPPTEAPAAETPEPEPAPLYDAGAYEAAAQAVRDEFIQVIQSDLNDFDEDAHPELPWYTAALTRFDENSYYEGYHDFDGNGVPEMLIAVGDDVFKTTIAVYAFDGQTMRYLCKDHPLGERSYLSYVDGLFVVHGSGGAASGVLAIYRIAEDGWSTEIVDVVEYEFTDAEHVTYTSELGTISEEDIVARGLADADHSVLIELSDWNCFYPG